jgi:hypothetical protein
MKVVLSDGSQSSQLESNEMGLDVIVCPWEEERVTQPQDWNASVKKYAWQQHQHDSTFKYVM